MPQYVAHGNGDGSFYFMEDRRASMNKALEDLSRYMDSSSILVSEITQEQYRESLDSYESLEVSFGYSLPYADLCSFYGMALPDGADNVNQIDAFAFSRASAESVFVKNESADTYYRLIFSEPIEDIHFIPGTQSATIAYRTGFVLGGQSAALLSLGGEQGYESMVFTAETPNDPDFSSKLTGAVFGDTLDFVRRMVDSFGNYTYMYGYGEKTLQLGVGGNVEYKGQEASGESQGFFGDLQKAVNFVGRAGGWSFQGENDMSFALYDVKTQMDGKNVEYDFCFGQWINGRILLNDEAYPVEVKVKNGSVVSYKRFIAQPNHLVSTSETPMEAADVLASNCNHIYNISTGNMLSVSDTQAYNFIADSILSMETGYFRSAVENQFLPCWIAETSVARFYFDLYTAEPLGFTYLN